MKKAIIFIFTFASLVSHASEALKPSSFSDIFIDIHSVESAERVFIDELGGIDLYKVSFLFETYNCSENSSDSSCTPTLNLEAECRYVFHDSHLNELEPTEFTCDRSIEDVIPVQLFDGL